MYSLVDSSLLDGIEVVVYGVYWLVDSDLLNDVDNSVVLDDIADVNSVDALDGIAVEYSLVGMVVCSLDVSTVEDFTVEYSEVEMTVVSVVKVSIVLEVIMVE